MAMTLEQAIGRMDAAVEIEEPQHTVFTADKATWAVIRAHLSQPAQAVDVFAPDWAGYRQGVLDGRRDAIEGAATGQSLGMVVYHDDEHAAARLEGQRVLIVPLPTPPADGEG